MYDSIQLAPTEDLIKELLSRFDAAVFSGMQIQTDKRHESVVLRHWKGVDFLCAGLASNLEFCINEKESDDDEDGEE